MFLQMWLKFKLYLEEDNKEYLLNRVDIITEKIEDNKSETHRLINYRCDNHEHYEQLENLNSNLGVQLRMLHRDLSDTNKKLIMVEDNIESLYKDIGYTECV